MHVHRQAVFLLAVAAAAATATTETSEGAPNGPITATGQSETFPTTEPPKIDIVPVEANIPLSRTLYPAGCDIPVPCNVKGFPLPRVQWFKDDLRLEPNEKIQITESHRLIILHASKYDNGIYCCEGVNKFGSSSSSISITVEGVYIHSECTDNPFFANCKIIVARKYCTHKYYARFCCKSCTQAGELPSFGPQLSTKGSHYLAKKMEYQKGCGCKIAEFGCCSDGKTPATGPDQAGCGCATSKYGCCIDGITSAEGESFQGCEDTPLAATDEPPYIEETDSLVIAEEANFATLKCNAFGNPPPFVTWSKDAVQIDIPESRHSLLLDGSLQIINLFKEDSGTYTCTAFNGVGDPAQKDIVLEVTDPTNHPAEIIGEENKIIITYLGAHTVLYCHAVGYPRPSIRWWREDRMIPLSSEVHEQGRDGSLSMWSVTLRNLGPFTCQAYNGLGSIASWTVTVKALGPVYNINPSDTAYTRYLVSPHDLQTPKPVSPHRSIYTPTQPDPPPVAEPPRVPVEANITLSRTIYPVGSDILIPCDVSGFPMPQVQWFKDGLLLEANENLQITETRLIISQAIMNNAGLYRCEAVNEYEASSSSISITVENEALYIQKKKMVLKAEEGSYATLKCDAFENQSLSFRWEKNSVQIDGSDSRYNLLDDISLQIINLFKEDAGTYTCTAVNGEGDSTQKDVILEVTDPTNHPAEIIGEENKIILTALGIPKILTCPAVGWPRPLITWWHGDHILPVLSQEYERRSDFSLLIKNVSLKHLGPFTCEANNGHGNEAFWTTIVKAIVPIDSIDPVDTAYVEYLIYPSFSEYPTSRLFSTPSQFSPGPHLANYSTTTTVIYSDPTNHPAEITGEENKIILATIGIPKMLHCPAVGRSRPSIRWWHGDHILPFFSQDYEQASNFSLLIRKVRINHLGPFTCEAYSDNENVASWTTILKAIAPVNYTEPEDSAYAEYLIFPRLSEYPTSQLYSTPSQLLPASQSPNCSTTSTNIYSEPVEANVTLARVNYTVGDDIFIPCTVSDYPLLDVQWYKDEVPLEFNDRILITESQHLVITKANKNDSGLYRCEAFNKNSMRSTSSIFIRVEGWNFSICDSELYGCCDDNKTSAHGPNKEGCCLNTEYGCCPDFILSAQGPNLEGCGCQYTPYGCCPDNTTTARGANSEGCGCRFTEHGCCPNQYTRAAGPNFEGCSCHTHQFGCCPDGITIARGPINYGCGCENTEFGCCSDGKTTAIGPELAGCDCVASKYGCCINGITSAEGEKFEGCEVAPIAAADACTQPRERGPCRNFTVKWYSDKEYGGCSRFWYGGCGGNDNRFKTQDECKNKCVTPPGRDACYLPKIEGPCEGYYPTWYYDTERKQCGQFIYGGCLGNDNKFETREECEELCIKPDIIDACEQHKREGPCEGNFSRWYYDQETKTCHRFIYGGCKGNANNFISESACHQQCLKPGRIQDYCTLPRAQGTCMEHIPQWFFDASEQRCMPFYYSGCEGNANRFETREACESDCPPSIEQDICTLPAVIGSCHNYTERWYYNTFDVRCTPFYYGGCDGNENNFFTMKYCQQRCESMPTPPPEQEFRRGESPYIEETDIVVTAEEANYITLKCDAFGNPPPSVTWVKGAVQVSSGSRHNLLHDGSLQIINLFKEDSGTYTCTAENGIGDSAQKDIVLEVTDPRNHPAEIIGEENKIIITSLGAPTVLYCHAVGYPRPSITWWRGDRMIPLSSRMYEQELHTSLLIRSVTLRNLGPFTCQAYNGLGRAASWTVTVKAVGSVYTIDPSDTAYTRYLISPHVPRTPQPPASHRPISMPTQHDPLPVTESPKVPVEANITLSRIIYPVGSDILIPCDVSGFPQPQVQWFKDGLLLIANEQLKITEDNRLHISQVSKNDAGLYRCEAVNEYGSSSSSISIIVEGVYIHPNCTDNPFFSNCKLIVIAKYCTRKYYARFCCKSCTQAGQLPSFGPHLESDVQWRNETNI